MTSPTLTQSLPIFMEAAFNDHSWLKREYGKVKGLLRMFAEHDGKLLQHLTLLDIANDVNVGDINPRLGAFIDRLQKPTKYKQQARSRLRRIIKALCGPEVISSTAPRVLRVPEFMRGVLPCLARELTNGDEGRPAVLCGNEQERLRHALTETGSQLLSALLLVVEENSINDLDSLFREHRSCIYDAIKRLHSTHRWQPVMCALHSLRGRIGYPESIIVKERIEFENWPVTLRSQFGHVKEMAAEGIARDMELTKLAAEHNVTVSPLEKTTLKLYKKSISIALAYILPHVPEQETSTLCIKDFLRLEPRTYERGGEVIVRQINPLVETYREHERGTVSTFKGERYDSSQFVHFIHAVRALAVYHGFFGPYQDLKANYTFNLDLKRRKDNKKLKKETFDCAWVDAEINRMLPLFRSIVKAKSFRFDTKLKNFSYKNAQRDMRFCLFFVLLVVLRFMGHRQQQLRNCTVGGNICFLPDSTIRFNWKEDLIKNDVEIDQELFAGYESHKILIEVLNTYYRHIYLPFVSQNGGTSPGGKDLLERQFFVRINRGCKFVRFDSDNPRNLRERFKQWSLEFMKFGERAKTMKRGLHPHFFRGLAVDWLVNVKRVPLQKAADYFGISVKTLMKHYLKESPKKSSAAALEAANAAEKTRQSDEELRKTKAELEAARRRVDELQSELLQVYKEGILAVAGAGSLGVTSTGAS